VQGQVSEVRSHWQQLDARSKSLEKTRQRLQSQEAAAESRRDDKNNEQLHALLRGHNN
jgi:flagellar biosynthesis chaperone FliJ